MCVVCFSGPISGCGAHITSQYHLTREVSSGLPQLHVTKGQIKKWREEVRPILRLLFRQL